MNHSDEFDDSERVKRQRRNELTDSGFISLTQSSFSIENYYQPPPEDSDRPLFNSTTLPAPSLTSSIELNQEYTHMAGLYQPADTSHANQLVAPPLALTESFSNTFPLMGFGLSTDLTSSSEPRLPYSLTERSASDMSNYPSAGAGSHPAPSSSRSFLLRSDSTEINDKLDESSWTEEHILRRCQDLTILKNNYDSVDKLLTRIRHRLKSAALPLTADHVAYMTSHLTQSRDILTEIATNSQKLIDTTLLPPIEIQRAFHLLRDSENLSTQLQLYEQEFDALRDSKAMPLLAVLVVAKHPFPKAIKKDRLASLKHEEPFIVRLLTGARASFNDDAEVHLTLLYDEQSEGASVELDQKFSRRLENEGYANFSDLKFMKGNRGRITRLKCWTRIQYSYNRGPGNELRSEIEVISARESPPFIVISNESQWEPSELKLIRKSIFEDSTPVSSINYCRLANHLQMHFLRGTRQDPSLPHSSGGQTRCLSLRDLRYFSNLEKKPFRSLQHIPKTEFESFWNWFGQVFRALRHDTILGRLWLSGLISFMSRQEAERCVVSSRGSFVIRFAERLDPVSGLVITYARDLSRSIPLFEHTIFDLHGTEKLLLAVQHKLPVSLTSVIVMNRDFLPSGEPKADWTSNSKDLSFSSFYKVPEPPKMDPTGNYTVAV